MKVITERSPHLRRKGNASEMMLDVVIALLPIVIFSFVVYRLYALRNLLISVLVFELCEFVFVLIKNRIPTDGDKHPLKEHLKSGLTAYKKHLSTNIIVPLVSGLIFGLISPVRTSNEPLIYLVLITGSMFGSIIGKLVFGGTGNNIFNPAAVGMVFSKICWGSYYLYPNPFASDKSFGVGNSFIDNSYEITTGATPISVDNINSINSGIFNTPNLSNYSLLDLFLGRIPGVMGEVCKLLIIIGFIYLVIRHTIDFHIPFYYLLSFYLFMLIAGCILKAGKGVNPFYFATYELLSGGLLFGAVFMATDPVTSPITVPGRVIYGVTLGALTTIMRLFASAPEGVVYSILIGNMLTPMIDYYKWSNNKWNLKKICVASSIFVATSLIIVWALCTKVL